MNEGEIQTIIDGLRFIIGVVILLYASYTDIKTRRAANYLWVIMGITGGVLLVIHYLLLGFDNYYYLIFIPVMIGFFYLMYQLRLLVGGADAKALMALAILVPIQPVMDGLPLWGVTFMPAVWSIFANSVILFLVIPVTLLLYNLTRRDIKFPHCLLGYKMSLDKARVSFVWPMEHIVDGKTKFSRTPRDEDEEEIFNKFKELGVERIWVTPKIPFMIPLLIGFVITFTLGDILTFIMRFFLSQGV
ncbi:MAG: A24 family peptidase C-terminal domain-containing protein [Candidatus Thermoplasmatota archaeon]